MKRIFIVIITFLVFLSGPIFGGGSSQGTPASNQASGVYIRDPNLNPPGTFPINKNTVSLTIGVQQSAVVENWKTNWMTQQIEKNGNYNLTFIEYPAGELFQKLELMVMAGGADLPDVVWGGAFSLGTLAKYGQAGMIIPVNTYFDNSAYYFQQRKSEFDIDLLKYVTSYDGNIYGEIYIFAALNNEYSANWLMVYEPWFQKLGIKMPGTLSEFETVLKAFKDQDPNGNGKQDEIPLVAEKGTVLVNMLRALMNPFIYTQNDYWIWNNGKIDVAYNKPAWREGLRYVKGLMDQGLISPLSFTQDAAQMNGMISPDPETVGYFARISGSNLGVNDHKRLEYIIQQPLEGPAGIQTVRTPTLPVIQMIITKNCKTPESAFVLGDYMCSEDMSVATRWGEKGVDWQVPAPGDKSVYDALGIPATVIPISLWGVLQNKWYAVTGPSMSPVKWATGVVASGLDHNIALGRSMEPIVRATSKVPPIVGLVYNEQEQQVIDEFQSTIISYVNECYARFVMGDLSIDRDWDNYVAEFNKMGLADIINATQSCWDRMNK